MSLLWLCYVCVINKVLKVCLDVGYSVLRMRVLLKHVKPHSSRNMAETKEALVLDREQVIKLKVLSALYNRSFVFICFS